MPRTRTSEAHRSSEAGADQHEDAGVVQQGDGQNPNTADLAQEAGHLPLGSVADADTTPGKHGLCVHVCARACVCTCVAACVRVCA